MHYYRGHQLPWLWPRSAGVPAPQLPAAKPRCAPAWPSRSSGHALLAVLRSGGSGSHWRARSAVSKGVSATRPHVPDHSLTLVLSLFPSLSGYRSRLQYLCGNRGQKGKSIFFTALVLKRRELATWTPCWRRALLGAGSQRRRACRCRTRRDSRALNGSSCSSLLGHF